MLCRVLIAAVAVTYLTCVLLLSGIQKEDLDVSMLTKLQRHNVNIDDLNNEKLIKECTQSRDSNATKKVKNITEDHLITNSASLYDNKTNAPLDIFKRTSNSNQTSNLSTDYNDNVDHEINKKASKVNVKEFKPNINNITQYYNDQFNVQNSMKYLQNMEDHKTVKHTFPQPVFVGEKEIKRLITDNQQLFETDTLNSLIANFLLKRKNIITKPTTTPHTLNEEDLYQKILSMHVSNTDINPSVNSGVQRTFASLPFQQNGRKTQIKKVIAANKSDTKTVQLNKPLLNMYKSFNPLIYDPEIVNRLKEQVTETSKLSINPFFNNFQQHERINPIDTITKEPKHEISRNMIKEIADSVKEIILRDLREQLHETTTFTTTTSTTTTQITTVTESTIKTTYMNENTKIRESVMNKFLELFEEIKSLKQNTIVIQNENRVNNKEVKQYNKYPQIEQPVKISNNLQPKVPFYTNKFYEVKQGTIRPPQVNSEKNFNFAPQMPQFRSNERPNKDLIPITLQTNNIEIAPLVIPLDKPQDLIRQNIVITTTMPHKIIPIEYGNSDPFKQENHMQAYKYFNGNKSEQSYLSKEFYKPPARQYSNSKDEILRLTPNNIGNSVYNGNYNEKINIEKYNPDLSKGEIKHKDTPRFHERLENLGRYLDYPEEEKYTDENDCCNDKYRYSEHMMDCCNKKIVSRHQKSFNNIKNKPYDDTHFENFLKSQQKVTEMLEKILGDKRSAESASFF